MKPKPPKSIMIKENEGMTERVKTGIALMIGFSNGIRRDNVWIVIKV